MLTINQGIPLQGVANATISIETMNLSVDLEALLDGVCLLENPLNVYCGAEAKTMLDLLWARIQNKGYKEYDYKGCVGADPIGEYARWGCAGCKDDLPKLVECLKFTKANMPQLKTIYIDGSV